MDPDTLELPRDSIDHVRKLALIDEVLNRALREWHSKQGSLPLDWQGKPFIEWVDCLIGHVAKQIATWCDATRPLPDDNDILCALRVNAIGDVFALYEEKTARKSFQTDINCYVEEGIVYSSIWLKGVDSNAVSEEADRIAGRMNSAGYSAETWIDEEDEHEVTVNAQIDFPLYRDMVSGGIAPACFLCPMRKCGKLQEANKKKGNSMSEEKSVEDRVMQFVRDDMRANTDSITRTTRFVDDLNADELDLVELVMAIEDEFGFAISSEDAEKFETIGDVIDYVENKLKTYNGKEESQEEQA